MLKKQDYNYLVSVNSFFFNSNLYKTNFKNSQITEKEEQFMLSAECVENNNEEEVIKPEEDTYQYKNTTLLLIDKENSYIELLGLSATKLTL